jgi:RNA polymerase sigma-70 factor (ECF subfamily)
VTQEGGTVATDSAKFASATEPLRRELLAHCYRMLGSVDDAEDLVQETYLRAWRSYSGFKGQSSERTWLYRIATNACLNALEHRSRRVLPSGLGGAEPDPDTAPEPAGPDVSWLQPIPDALVSDAMVSPDSADPAAIITAREGLRLALIASLQYLPGPQRAVLILRDVLAFPAAEVAVILGTTTTAVKSTLQRARARLREVAPAADDVTEPAEPQARALVDRYIAAFQNADAAALQRLLCADATLEATPFRTWFAGCETCVPFLRAWVLGAPGDWRMLPTRANGQPAAICYCRDPDGAYQAYGIVAFTMAAAGITRINSFGDPALVRAFGFPPVLPASATRPLLSLEDVECNEHHHDGDHQNHQRSGRERRTPRSPPRSPGQRGLLARPRASGSRTRRRGRTERRGRGEGLLLVSAWRLPPGSFGRWSCPCRVGPHLHKVQLPQPNRRQSQRRVLGQGILPVKGPYE